jgi:hypothetical protein
MELKQLEVFSEELNFAVVRMPGRRFPGCVIQGDSLSVLCGLARSIHNRLASQGDDEASEDAAELLEKLTDRLEHYEQVLAKHGIHLPHAKS